MGTSVSVLAFDGISPFHMSVPGIVFGELSPSCGITDWSLTICGETPGVLRTADGYNFRVEHGLAELASANIIILPSWSHPANRPSPDLVAAVSRAHAQGSMIVGLCLGAFVVAATGLLNGRRATTHWKACGELARMYSEVIVDPSVLYVDEGDVVTSAGTAASLDACVNIVRGRLGAAVANHVARSLVVAPHREGGQAQYIERPVPATGGGDPIARTMEWALKNLASPLSVELLAVHANMSVRNFSRSFVNSTGETPAMWVRQQRLAEAQRLLEETDASIDQVAAASGFSSAVTLRQNFSAAFGISPAAYRRGFSARQRPLFAAR